VATDTNEMNDEMLELSAWDIARNVMEPFRFIQI
jgi:hypothetical protein